MYLDEQYIRIMGSRLDRFKPLARQRYECRCPICGDSKKDKKKARGNFFIWRGSWLYKCHNCGKSMGVSRLLEHYFPDLYDEYLMGKTRDRMAGKTKNDTAQFPKNDLTKPPKNDLSKEIDLPRISELPENHHAVSYIQGRKIPSKYHHDLFYAERFKEWSNKIVPGVFKNTDFDDDRIVIPFRDEKDRIFAFQGRALKKTKLKYLTVKIDQNRQKIYGLNRIDQSKPVYVVEGPLDSLFVENCLGTADSSLDSITGVNANLTFVWDNEPRSKIITQKIENAIESGKSVVIWKKSNTFNDINDAIMYHGYTEESINKLIEKRTFQGLEALLELQNWRKN